MGAGPSRAALAGLCLTIAAFAAAAADYAAGDKVNVPMYWTVGVEDTLQGEAADDVVAVVNQPAGEDLTGGGDVIDLSFVTAPGR